MTEMLLALAGVTCAFLMMIRSAPGPTPPVKRPSKPALFDPDQTQLAHWLVKPERRSIGDLLDAGGTANDEHRGAR